MEKEIKVKSVKLTENAKKEPKVKGKTPLQRAKSKKEKLQYASALRASYCRYCNKMKEYEDFQDTSNPFIDKNGKLSICNDCLEQIYNELFQTFNNEKQAFYAFCQHVDIVYDESCIDTAIDSLKKYSRNRSVATSYWKIVRMNYQNQPFRFRNTRVEKEIESALDREFTNEDRKELIFKWGKFNDDEYRFLENSFDEYSSAFGMNGPNERDGYKTLAILLLRQRANPENRDITTAIKAQYELLGIDPKQLRKESKEQGSMTLGLTIAQMEQTDPADYFENPEMYVDHSGIQKDLKSIIRATKNFLIEGNNDFVEEDIDMSQIYNSDSSED